MLPEGRDPAYLHDMLTAARNITHFVAGKSRQNYEENLLLRSGVERQIEILGEAARRVSTAFKGAHPEVPWRRIVAQRNVLIHEYDEVLDVEIWDVASVHVPALVPQLEVLVPPLPPED